jgi:hypothetical protein
MATCHITLDVEGRGQVYADDFSPIRVFGAWVRAYISDLIVQGAIQKGQRITATITPRYDAYLVPAPTVQATAPPATPPASWLTLDTTHADPNQPAAFFTLKLRVWQTDLVYSQDFPVRSLEEFWHTLEASLLEEGVLHKGDHYLPRVYIRDVPPPDAAPGAAG